MNSGEGFTGLEAAIVLIAFIVVASVFSFAVLGAGFYATQKTQEVVYSSIDSAGSTPQLVGNVYGIGDGGSPAKINAVRFSIDLSAGGKIIDLKSLAATLSTSSKVTDLTFKNTKVTESEIAAGECGVIDIKPASAGDDLFLEPDEIYTLYVHFPDDCKIAANERFTLEMKSASSGTFTISRRAPQQVDAVNQLI